MTGGSRRTTGQVVLDVLRCWVKKHEATPEAPTHKDQALRCPERHKLLWLSVAGCQKTATSPGFPAFAFSRPLPFFSAGLISPEGLAIDHLRRTMFWTDSGLDKIESAKLDGSERRVLFATDLVNPRAIAVDPIRGSVAGVGANSGVGKGLGRSWRVLWLEDIMQLSKPDAANAPGLAGFERAFGPNAMGLCPMGPMANPVVSGNFPVLMQRQRSLKVRQQRPP